MVKTAALAIALLLITIPRQAPVDQSVSFVAEFPPQDVVLAMNERDGVVAKRAERLLAEAPDSVDTVRALAEARNLDGLLRALRVIVDTQPRSLAGAFEAIGPGLWQFRGNDEQSLQRREALRQIVADVRTRLPGLPPEEAARTSRVLVGLDSELAPEKRDYDARLLRFIEEYRGTEAALLAEVDAIGYGRPSRQKLDALEAFAAAHPGSTAGAKALYTLGFEWHTINTIGTVEPRGADPTPRFLRVLAIVQQLESGQYPQSEWVRKAPDLVIGFFMPSDAKISPGNLDALIAAHEGFMRTRFSLDALYPGRGGMGYVVTDRLAKLFAMKGEREKGVERVLSDLERTASDPSAVRYLRALFYLQAEDGEAPVARQARLAKARDELTALSTAGGGLYHRRALATLAALEFENRNYEVARGAFQRYAASYPKSGWTWVAIIRAGQCAEEMNDPKAAVADYLHAAAEHADIPLAKVLGLEYAARTHETMGELEKAVAEHQQALDAWDKSFTKYSTYVKRSPNPGDPFVIATDIAEVTKDSLAPRIARLKASIGVPGGDLLERGRALLARGRNDEAIAEIQILLDRYPQSPAAREARYLSHRARLDRALQLTDPGHADADRAAAAKELEALAREPHDFAVTAAKIAVASLLWTHGDGAAAERTMEEALSEWHSRQQLSTPQPGIEQDVAEIRRVVFLPQGGGVYRGAHWNAFDWESAKAFSIVNADTRVKTHDGDVSRVTLIQAFPDAGKTLFFDTEQLALLHEIIVKLGGTKRREPQQIMETPNQPVGDSTQILRLWNKFFAARPGHWGGWELETYPRITEIQFTNPERTKAAARVTIGYSGATVELEKEGGQWVAKRLTSQWVT